MKVNPIERDAIQYLLLYKALNSEAKIPMICPVTIAALADMLYCTPRNVKFVLRKLENLGWIRWQPGKGRGNTSQLEFLYSEMDMLEQQIEIMLDKDRVKEALELVSGLEDDEVSRERLWHKINIYLGLHREQEASCVQDVLRMVHYRPLESLNPLTVFTAFEVFLLRQLFDTLVVYDPQTGYFAPGLAHLWEMNEDQLSWTFYLRKGIRFHDGSLLTAYDVQSTLMRLQMQGNNIIWMYQDITEVEIHTEYMLTFHLKRPNRMFLHLISNVCMSIVSQHDQHEGAPNGTGAFRIAELTESKLSLAAFDTYYGMRPMLDRVDIWFMPERKHSNRYFRLTDPDEEDAQDSRQINQPAMGGRYLLFNFRIPGVQHCKLFRQAVRLLYDRHTMLRELGRDRIAPAGSFLPWKSAEQNFQEASLDEAKLLLEQSRYNNQVLQLNFADKKEERMEAEWLQQRAAAIGLQIQLSPQSRKLVIEGHMTIAVEVLENDWEWDLLNYFSNEGNYLYLMLADEQQKQLRELLADIMQLEQQERIHKLEQAEQLLRDEYWLLLGNHINQRSYIHRNLYGLHLDSFGFPNLSSLWIKHK